MLMDSYSIVKIFIQQANCKNQPIPYEILIIRNNEK